MRQSERPGGSQTGREGERLGRRGGKRVALGAEGWREPGFGKDLEKGGGGMGDGGELLHSSEEREAKVRSGSVSWAALVRAHVPSRRCAALRYDGLALRCCNPS